MQKPSTKDRIMMSALTLFSEKGYDGTGIDLIAENCGMKGPSIYKHFKGKEDILNGLIDKLEIYYEMNFGSRDHVGQLPENCEELIQTSMKRVSFTMHDEMIARCRKLMAKEQFRNDRLAELATNHFLTGVQNMYAEIFKGMMEKGLLKQEDCEILALEYTAPATVLIHVYDRQPEKEREVLTLIEKHFRHFVDIYRI